MYNDPRSLRGDYSEIRGEDDPIHDTGFLLETSRLRSEPVRRRTGRKGSANHNDEICGRTDRQAEIECERGSSGPAVSHGDGAPQNLQEEPKWAGPGFLERGSEASQACVEGKIK